MPYDGTGVYNPPASPTFPAVGGTVIQADYYNAVIRDIAAALTNALKRDGQGPWTGPQNAGGQKLTQLGAGTLDNDAVTLKQLRDTVAAGAGTLTTNTLVTPASGEARVGVTYIGTEPVYLFSNSTSYGIYSTTGGTLIDYERATGKKRLGGTIDIATLVKNDGGTYGIDISGNAATATTAGTATTATTAANANAVGGVPLSGLWQVAGSAIEAPGGSALDTQWSVTLPNGMVFKGGRTPAGLGNTVITFTDPFPTRCLNVQVTIINFVGADNNDTVAAWSATGVTIRSDGSSGGSFWLAVGE